MILRAVPARGSGSPSRKGRQSRTEARGLGSPHTNESSAIAEATASQRASSADSSSVYEAITTAQKVPSPHGGYKSNFSNGNVD
jgi:hypothetical protein